jgi:diguanylate cyclase (GGDEF)-like protein
LIIEDNERNLYLVTFILEKCGYRVVSARDGEAGIALARQVKPDLILLDIRLGIEISGEDILYQIRSNPRFDKTRVVVTTAYPWLAEPITNLADLVLVKPVGVDQLRNLMQRLGSLDFKSKFQVYRDPVTELFNDEFFQTRLELAFERAKRRKDFHFGVIAIDVQLTAKQQEEIKPDALLSILREVAGRLKKFVRPTDAVSRLAGWKFATLHEDLNHPDEIQTIVNRLSEKLSRPYDIDDDSHKIKISLRGLVHEPYYRDPVDILNAAQKAMNEVSPGSNPAPDRVS